MDVSALLDSCPAVTDLCLSVPQLSSRALPEVGRLCPALKRVVLDNCSPLFFLSRALESSPNATPLPALHALLLLSRGEQAMRYNARAVSSMLTWLQHSPLQYLKLSVHIPAADLQLFASLHHLRSLQVIVEQHPSSREEDIPSTGHSGADALVAGPMEDE